MMNKFAALFAPRLRALFRAREVIAYGAIGTCCSALNVAFFWLLRKLTLSIALANLISLNTTMFIAFILNARFNFKVATKPVKRAIQYFAVCYAGLAAVNGNTLFKRQGA